MEHTQKSGLVFRRNGRVHLNRPEGGLQFSRLLAAEVCASAVVMLDTPCSEVVWRVLATHCIRQFPLHFPSRESPCAITFQLESTATDLTRLLQLFVNWSGFLTLFVELDFLDLLGYTFRLHLRHAAVGKKKINFKLVILVVYFMELL